MGLFGIRPTLEKHGVEETGVMRCKVLGLRVLKTTDKCNLKEPAPWQAQPSPAHRLAPHSDWRSLTGGESAVLLIAPYALI